MKIFMMLIALAFISGCAHNKTHHSDGHAGHNCADGKCHEGGKCQCAKDGKHEKDCKCDHHKKAADCTDKKCHEGAKDCGCAKKGKKCECPHHGKKDHHHEEHKDDDHHEDGAALPSPYHVS